MRFTQLTKFAFAALVMLAGQANATQTIFGTYYDDDGQRSGDCTAGATTCTIVFSQTPSNALVLVTNVACNVISGGSTVVSGIMMVQQTSTGSPLPRNLPLPLVAPTIYNNGVMSGVNSTSFNSPVNFLVGQGRYPAVQFTASSTAGLVWNPVTCHLTGSLVSPAQ